MAFVADRRVVEVRGGREAVLLEGKLGVVVVDEVRLIRVHQVLATQIPGARELGVHGRDLFVPLGVVELVPGIGVGDGLDAVGHDQVAAGVKLLRIEALPPLALAVGPGQVVRIVADALHRPLGVVGVSGLQPVPGVRGVVGHRNAQAVRPRDFGVRADDVLLRPDLHRVPVVEARVVVVEVVVVVGQRGEILCAGGDVQVHQLFRLPVLRLPQVVDLHPAHFGRMAVGVQMMLVLRLALQVHAAGVPVTLLRDALRGPVVPYAEFCVAEPIGRLVAGLQRLPSRLEWAGRDMDIRGRLGKQPRREGGGGRSGECGLNQVATSKPGRGHGRHHSSPRVSGGTR